MTKEMIFKILAAVLLITAAYFYWDSTNDFAFFFLVLSACSFLMNIRSQAKARLASGEDPNLENSRDDR